MESQVEEGNTSAGSTNNQSKSNKLKSKIRFDKKAKSTSSDDDLRNNFRARQLMSFEAHDELHGDKPTSYMETLMHLFKGNVGAGCYAIADAVKNGGLILAPILLLILAIITVHAQHVLLQCSAKMRQKRDLKKKPDYAETVELSFLSSNSERCQKMAPIMKRICNIFICITQIGFCCIYFLFIQTNLKQVLDFYGIYIGKHVLLVIILIPVWLSTLITNLKYLAPCSAIANVCMIIGLVISYYYSSQDLPPISERNFVPANINRLPLFFGNAISAFEGIALVLPLENAMKTPKNFSKLYGVLNVGMVLVTGIFISFGSLGYWKYGEATEPSLTLNLPQDEVLAQCVKMTTAFGVLLGYAIQFYVAIQIMYPSVRGSINYLDKHPKFGELIFRTLIVLVTFAVAAVVPNLSLLLSLVGSVCSTVLALTLPPLIEFIITKTEQDELDWFLIIKNSAIILIAIVGFITGAYESLYRTIEEIVN